MNQNKPKRICCIFSRILGLNTMANRLCDALDSVEEFSVDKHFITLDDYRNTPGLYRMTDLTQTCYAAKKAGAKIKPDGYDLFILNSYELTLAFRSLVKKIPTLVVTDTTPTLSADFFNREREKADKLKFFLKRHILKFIFNGIFKRVKLFLPISELCARSLREEFLISPDHMRVLYIPIDLNQWTQAQNSVHDGQPMLLFVGNDIKRKGGEFLFQLYENYFQGQCGLRVISNDKKLKDMRIPDGVEVVQGLTHQDLAKIVSLYQTSDIFLFPSWRDFLPNVLPEAMACGLPIIARDVGGVNECVFNDCNGYLMPYESTEKDWAQKIQYLLDRPEERRRMGLESRRIAEEKFDQQKFNDTVRLVIGKVLAECGN